jgi:eukaryotic-like serine/threonine-protein kinase
MSTDFTQAQGSEELERSLKLSQQRACPPCDVPGYEPRRFLGAGAYGEVWVAIDRTTGRQVAIKFYLHRGGLDWSLLSHEVEKLAFLSADRYVVQLLDVGWESEPPYYVMEFVENGSLNERLEQEGRLSAMQATAMVREIAIGLTHSHSKGILHCDLKPANILLDQDGKPRLADFGQSRLSHEQTPALGTLFYMAPEQADSQAVPDARWDVYALGAIFYAMLLGRPPHRREETLIEIESAPHLEGRLERYRRLIEHAPPPTEHYHVRGVDKELATIIDRCLAVDPAARFPTIQSVLDALDARERRRSRRPLVVLGALGPMLLLAVMAAAAWLWFSTSLEKSTDALTESALKGLGFAAQSAARGAGAELQSRFYDVEEAARDPAVIEALSGMETDPKMHDVLVGLSKKHNNDLVELLRSAPEATTLQNRLRFFDHQMLAENKKSESWFITDSRGVQVARWYAYAETLGRDYAWSSYFYGGTNDQPKDWRPAPEQHVQKTQLSAAHTSNSSGLWVVSISTPVFKGEMPEQRQFLGVIGVSFELATNFINLQEEDRQFPLLVDEREGAHNGLILQHPLLQKLRKQSDEHLDRFINDEQYRLSPTVVSKLKEGVADYRDPLGADAEGTDYRERYLAAEAPIELLTGEGRNQHEAPSGWVIVVQDPYKQAIGTTLHELRASLLGSGLAALGIIGLVILGQWWSVMRMVESPARWQPISGGKATANTQPTPR